MTPLFVTIPRPRDESSFALAQDIERRAVFRAGTHERREAFHRFHVVIEDIGRGIEHDLDAPILRVKVGHQELR